MWAEILHDRFCVSKKVIFTSFLSVLTISCTALSATFSYKGRIANWEGETQVFPVVEILSSKANTLANDLLVLEHLPEDLTPDSTGCFCFSETDWRFAYVHAFVHATEAITQFNRILHDIGKTPLEKIAISLLENPTHITGGQSDYKSIYISVPRPAFDFSVMIHELSHEVHQHLLGDSLLNILTEAYYDQDWTLVSEQAMVSEGTANILAALIINEPHIGYHDYNEAIISVDRFVRFPDQVPTNKDQNNMIRSSQFINKNYPDTIKDLNAEIEQPSFPELVEKPSPYLASAAINQPLWKAAQIYGNEKILKVYLKSLVQLPNLDSPAKLKEQILKQAEHTDKNLASYLDKEFHIRGL